MKIACVVLLALVGLRAGVASAQQAGLSTVTGLKQPETDPRPAPLKVRRFDIARVSGGVDLPHLVMYPPNYTPGPAYPVVVFMSDGAQDEAAVAAEMERDWEQEAAARGWVVVGLAAPLGNTLLRVSGDAFRGFLHELIRTFPAEGGKYYIVGSGEGGKAALNLAAQNSDLVRAVLVKPGFAEEWFRGTVQAGLKETPVTFLIGEQDREYYLPTEATIAAVQEVGGSKAYMVVMPGEVRPLSVRPAQVFDLLEGMAKGQGPTAVFGKAEQDKEKRSKVEKGAADQAAVGAIEAVLDGFHEAAARAEFERYFSYYAPGAVFLGTDAKERWTLEEFKAFARPYFDQGKGWKYTPVKGGRFVVVEGKDVAWFDEKLENAKLGVCRGSGVLVKIGDAWKVKQYNLTMLVPNEIAEKVAGMAREELEKSKGGK